MVVTCSISLKLKRMVTCHSGESQNPDLTLSPLDSSLAEACVYPVHRYGAGMTIYQRDLTSSCFWCILNNRINHINHINQRKSQC